MIILGWGSRFMKKAMEEFFYYWMPVTNGVKSPGLETINNE